MNARITLTFILEDFDKNVDDWLTDGTTVQDAANLALGDMLEEYGIYDLIEFGNEPLEWSVEYPAKEATE